LTIVDLRLPISGKSKIGNHKSKMKNGGRQSSVARFLLKGTVDE
jgi:hypothetical protein